MDNYSLATERGVLKICYKDCLKQSLTACHVDLCWSDMAADRDIIMMIVYHDDIIVPFDLQTVNEFKENKRYAQDGKGSQRKA